MKARGKAALAAGAALLCSGCKPGDREILALTIYTMMGLSALLLQAVVVVIGLGRRKPRYTLGFSVALGVIGVVGAVICNLIVLDAPHGARARVVREAFWQPAVESLLLVGGALLMGYIYFFDEQPPATDADSPRPPVPWAPWLAAWLLYGAALVADGFALAGLATVLAVHAQHVLPGRRGA